VVEWSINTHGRTNNPIPTSATSAAPSAGTRRHQPSSTGDRRRSNATATTTGDCGRT